jgi:hypothetical protein
MKATSKSPLGVVHGLVERAGLEHAPERLDEPVMNDDPPVWSNSWTSSRAVPHRPDHRLTSRRGELQVSVGAQFAVL